MTPAQELTRRFGGRWMGSYGVIPTPGHAKRDQGTTIHDRADGKGVVINCFNDDWRNVRAALGLSHDQQPLTKQQKLEFTMRRAAAQRSRDGAVAKRVDRATALWNAAVTPEPAGAVRRYLATRGIPDAVAEQAIAFDALRECRVRHGQPGMLVRACDVAGSTRAVQLTKLRRDGLGKCGNPSRLTFGSLRNCSVPLFSPRDGTLAITEGTEDALAFFALYGIPAWPVLGTANVVSFVPPRGLRTLYIATDGDVAGRECADKLFARLRRQLRCIIATAPEGLDWADVAASRRGGIGDD
ncbi:MAG: toprim domain-containing protein [Hyphomonadaceae bacterium]